MVNWLYSIWHLNAFYNIPAKWVFSLCLKIFNDWKYILEKSYSVGLETMDFGVRPDPRFKSQCLPLLTSSVHFGSYITLWALVSSSVKWENNVAYVIKQSWTLNEIWNGCDIAWHMANTQYMIVLLIFFKAELLIRLLEKFFLL